MSKFVIVRNGGSFVIAREVVTKDDVTLMEVVGKKARSLPEAILELRKERKGSESLETLIEDVMKKDDAAVKAEVDAAEKKREEERVAKKAEKAAKKEEKKAEKPTTAKTGK